MGVGEEPGDRRISLNYLYNRQKKGLLGFELVGQDEIGVAQEVLVEWYDIFAHIDVSIIAHHRIKH